MSFSDTVIQKIYRDYSKDESIMFLKKEIQKILFEKGIIQSELDAANYEIECLKKEISELKSFHNRKKQGWQSAVIGLERHIEKLQKELYEQRN
jgi:dynactin complex subunit